MYGFLLLPRAKADVNNVPINLQDSTTHVLWRTMEVTIEIVIRFNVRQSTAQDW